MMDSDSFEGDFVISQIHGNISSMCNQGKTKAKRRLRMTKEGNGEQNKTVIMSLHMKCLLATVFCLSHTITTAVPLPQLVKTSLQNRTISFRERPKE